MQNPLQAVVTGDFIHVRFPKNRKDLLTQLRFIESRHWHDAKQFWSLKISVNAISFVVNNNFDIPDSHLNLLQNKLERLLKEATIKEERFKLSKAIIAPVIPEIAAKMKIPAWEYQWAPTHYALMADGRFIIGDEMATGKSIESLMMVNHPQWEHLPVAIVTKTPETYQNEIAKFFGQPSIVVNSPLQQLHPKVRYYISSYHRLKNFFLDTELELPRPYCDEMFWIFDEAHQIKNPKTQRTILAKAASRNAPHVVLMTGTPIPNNAEEIYYLLKLIYPNFISKSKFLELYCGIKWTANGKTESNTNYQGLKQWLYETCFIRRTKKQVLPQLPDKIRETHFIKDAPVYVQASSIFEMFAKSAQLKSTDKDFLAWIEIILKETPGKVGFVAEHICMIDALEKLHQKLGIKYIKIDGDTAPESRQGLCTQFAQGDYKSVMFTNAVGGTGLNDLQCADYVIFTELNMVPANILQAEDRFHRPGMKGCLTVLYSIFSELELHISAMILDKLGTIERVIGHEDVPDSIKQINLMGALAQKFGLPIGGRL